MRIGFDISPVIYDTGVGFYTRNVVRELCRDGAIDMTLFGSSLRQHSALKTFTQGLRAAPKLFHLPPKLSNLSFHKLNLPIEWFAGELDVFHAWDWYIPRTKKAALVTTVHDLAMFKFPHIAHPEILKHHQTVLGRINALNAMVIAVSETTKQDLIDLFEVNPERVHVIPEALPEEAHITVSENEVKNVLKKYSITRPYFLSVGTKEPRKNYLNQMKAWETYKKDYQYVIVGKKGWQELPKKDNLIALESVSARELAVLYLGADLLLYASLYEGFGLPILEAFYHRIPVVTSNISSMPEVAGRGAILVDPQSVDSIRGGINSALEKQKQLVEEGSMQLSQFSWKETAAQTIAVYRKAYER
jgi:glycosyltransferase involved in cell wall biosynthesis